MKHFARLIFLALLAAACSASPDENLGPIDEALSAPVAAYGFDEASGSTVIDSSGNKLNGSLNNGSRVGGKHGGAVRLTGNTASWVTVPDTDALDLTTGMTVEAWVNPASLSSWRSVVYKERSNGSAYVLYANTSSNRPLVGFTSTSGSWRTVGAGSQIPTNSWTHLAGTFDGKTLKLYRNGTLAGSLGTTSTIVSSTGPLRMGGSATEGERLNGAIDDVRIYNRALSQAEIQADMNASVGSVPDSGSDAPAGQDAGTDVASEAAPDALDAAKEAAQDAPVDASDAPAVDAPQDVAAEARDASRDVPPDVPPNPMPDAAPPPPPNGTYPLRKLAGARYLVDQAGSPFLVHGDTAWSLMAQVSTDDATTYLADRQARGVNSVIANLVEHYYASRAPANAEGVQPFTTPGDFSTPNEAYFAHVDAVIRAAAARGIQVFLVPAYLGWDCSFGVGWYEVMAANGATKMFNWGAYVGARYRSFDNLVWVMGGDCDPPNKGLVEAVANGIRSVDTRHLMTTHGEIDSSLDNWAGETWLDFDTVYTYPYAGNEMRVKVLGEYQRSNWLPLLLVETRYEFETPAPAAELRQYAYETLLNGGMGQFFGNSPIWCFGSGCLGDNWKASLASQGAQDQQRVKAFFAGRAWWKLVPDTGRAFLTAGFSDASPSRATDGSWAAAYFPSSRAVTVNLASFSHAVRGAWYDPGLGTTAAIQGSPFAPSGTLNLTSPNGDSVLVFE